MASITSLMGGASSTSSIYGNRNVLSGLASGMDTEAMIENAISGYNTKIASLKQDYTMLEWQQNAFRSIISKMSNFSNKYLSYTSSTNLLSQSFFNSAINVKSLGEHASKVTATGRGTSDVQVVGVKKLATAATYSVKGMGDNTIKGEAVDMGEIHEKSNVTGTLKINYGNDRSFKLNFTADDVVTTGEELAKKIEEKLAEQEITINGQTSSADTRIKVNYDAATDTISLSDGGSAGNNVWFSGGSGDIIKNLGIDASYSYNAEATSFTVGDPTALYSQETNAQRLAGQKMTFTLDGASADITLSGAQDSWTMDDVAAALETELDNAFGAGKIDVTVDTQTGGLVLSPAQSDSTLKVSNGKALGLASNSETSAVDTSKTLGSLLDESAWQNLTSVGTDEDGNAQYEFLINGKSVGTFTKNSTLGDLMNAVNKSDAGVSVTYSGTTNRFQFTAKNTGSGGKVEMGEGLAQALFGNPQDVALNPNPDPGEDDPIYTQGQDATLTLNINGHQFETTRTSNSFEVDGLNIKLNGTFNYEGDTLVADAQAVSFKTESDADTIVNAIKTMVADYNEMASEIKNAYSTMPQYDSSGDRYKPLTEDDQADMTESAIKNYEEKAKQGILFADRDLNNLYTSLTNAFNSAGSALKSIGINITYEDGATTLTLDENKLRSTLESDPDKVRDVLAGDGAKDSALQQVSTTLDRYGKLTGENKGILVEKAGTPLSSRSLLSNQLLTQMNNINEQIEKWQDKMSDQVDYYTRQFTALEQLILEMNSQSSALMGLMGG